MAKEKPMNKLVSIQEDGGSYYIIGGVESDGKKPRIRIQDKSSLGQIGLNINEIDRFIEYLRKVSKAIQEEADRL